MEQGQDFQLRRELRNWELGIGNRELGIGNWGLGKWLEVEARNRVWR
ncbi:MAG: hypothetical protein F6K47_26495 [Symploca sp. SIO2E6]|nr:hypothetical protein [Symploca sp. SIO2E6]